MGVYDTVNVPCPKCGERQEAQSKSGDCVLAIYEMESCPADVLANVNRHAPFTCEKCGTVFEVKLTVVAQSVPLAQVDEAQQCLHWTCGIRATPQALSNLKTWLRFLAFSTPAHKPAKPTVGKH